MLRPFAKHPSTITRAFLPPPSLRRHLIFALERDTRGCTLHPLQSLTYGPAVPNMAIIWLWHGHINRLIDWHPDNPEAPSEQLLGPVIIKGGASKTWIQFSDQPIHSLIALFRPDAMRQLFGIDPSDWTDQTRPIQNAELGPRWTDICKQILTAQDSTIALPILYKELEDQLAKAKPLQPKQEPESTKNWISHLQNAAPARLSQRSLQTKVKALTGTTIRQLRRLVKMEDLALSVSQNYLQEPTKALATKRLGDFAAEADFADQAHMNREVRRSTGFTMGETLTRLMHHESFWLYRAKLQLHLNPTATSLKWN